MKPPKSQYTQNSKTWVLTQYGTKIQTHHVDWDEARNEIGIHLLDVELNSREWDDALETAERDGFKRIFLHKYPKNVLKFG